MFGGREAGCKVRTSDGCLVALEELGDEREELLKKKEDEENPRILLTHCWSIL